MSERDRGGAALLARLAAVLGAIAIFVAFGLPLLGAWLAAPDWFSIVRGLPSSGLEAPLYLAVGLLGVFGAVAYSDEKVRAIRQPIARFVARGGALPALVLAAPPLAIGASVLARGMHGGIDAPESRPILHPTPPDAFSKLSNPLRDPDRASLDAFVADLARGRHDESTEAAVRETAEQARAGTPSGPAVRDAFVRAATAEGRDLFQRDCRPCHGALGRGDGPLARGLARRPADFGGVETIATLVEGAVFWRVTEGGARLPRVGAPWESAMPRWGLELSEADRWKAILAAYDLAGNRPRAPE